MKTFREGLRKLNQDNPGQYSHQFGYTGRSHSQAIVERFNGTIKRITDRRLGNQLEAKWRQYLPTAVANYNKPLRQTQNGQSKRSSHGY